MRLPVPIRPLARDPQPENRVPLKVVRPMKLRDFVSGRGDKTDSAACIQEMMTMMACLKTAEFEECKCLPEIKKFQTCVTDNKRSYLEREEQIQKGITVGAKRLSHVQLNKILEKFPSKG